MASLPDMSSTDSVLSDLVQKQSRPFYFYNLDDVEARAKRFLNIGARTHYAMKANSHPRLLRLIRDLGLGVDVVSLGELQAALAQGFAPGKIIFSGVGKGQEELSAAVHHGILQINAESFEELMALGQISAAAGRSVDVALRVNIHLDAPTHKNIQTATHESKFGLDQRQVPEVLDWLKKQSSLKLKSLTVHVGSQILDVGVFEKMSQRIGSMYAEIKASGFPLQRLDLGGGLGINYQNAGEDDFERLEMYARALSHHGTEAEIILEPGRFLVARMGVLMARVVYVKRAISKQFVILNAGMNCLMRPALYQAYHRIEPLKPRSGARQVYAVVGPLCESTDTFAEARELPPVEAGDWIKILDTGAYGAVLANTYNESPFPAQWSVYQGSLEVL